MTTITEIVPNELSDAMAKAMDEGRLGRYTQELEKEIERLRECIKNSSEAK